jgi:hypothetical protein
MKKTSGKFRLYWTFSNIYNYGICRIIMKRVILPLLMLVFVFLLAGIYAQNETSQTAENTTITENISIHKLLLTNFMPKEAKLGDVQFNLQVQNNQNETASDIIAFVTGAGFSTYEMIPIESLATMDKSYIFVYGNLKQEGNITLTIKINDDTFYQNITVINPDGDKEKLEEIQKEQEISLQIKNISDSLVILRQNFSDLETLLEEKEGNNYDVSSVNLNTLDNYIHNIQADILIRNVDDAKVNLELAYDEYGRQKGKIENAEKVPLITLLKNNVVLFTTFAGAILTFFALFELLKKKRQEVKLLGEKLAEKKEELKSKEQKKKKFWQKKKNKKSK